MSSLPLHLLLLFAVTCSQLFGGVACCCLSRAILSKLTTSSANDSLSVKQLLAASSQGIPKCPKCLAASAWRANGQVKSDRLWRCSLTENSACRCVKVTADTCLPFEPISPLGWLSFVAIESGVQKSNPSVGKEATRSFEVPIRFGGHRWQSLACIWKK